MQEIESSIRGLVDVLVAAWNCGDLDAFVRLFADDASYVTATGDRLRGLETIRRALGSRPSDPSAPPQVSIFDLEVIPLGSDVAVALVRWRMVAEDRAGLFTLVTTATREGWRIVLLHNTDSAA